MWRFPSHRLPRTQPAAAAMRPRHCKAAAQPRRERSAGRLGGGGAALLGGGFAPAASHDARGSGCGAALPVSELPRATWPRGGARAATVPLARGWLQRLRPSRPLRSDCQSKRRVERLAAACLPHECRASAVDITSTVIESEPPALSRGYRSPPSSHGLLLSLIPAKCRETGVWPLVARRSSPRTRMRKAGTHLAFLRQAS